MPKPSEFSEFSYGYAVTEALVQKWRPSLSVAPSFLSLTEEGEPAKGYDASLQPRGVPIFLQFKLSELLFGGSTRETRGGVPILPPYYRFTLRTTPPGNCQHESLLGLDIGKNVVRYVAPLFTKLEDFDRHYREKKILSESIFLKPRLFGTFSDTERHCVSFTDRKNVHWLSEPHTAHESTDDDTLRQDVEAAIRDVGDTALSPTGLSDLLGQMVRVIDRDVRDFAVAGRHDELLNYVGYLARVYFQAEMLVVRVANTPPRSATLAPPPSGTGDLRLGGAQAS